MPGDQGLYRRTLANAIKVAGGEEALREILKVPEPALRAWQAGVQPISEAVFLQLIDIVLDRPPYAPQPQGAEEARKPKA